MRNPDSHPDPLAAALVAPESTSEGNKEKAQRRLFLCRDCDYGGGGPIADVEQLATFHAIQLDHTVDIREVR